MATARGKQRMAEAMESDGEEGVQDSDTSGEWDGYELTLQQHLELQGLAVEMSRTPAAHIDGVVHGWGALDFKQITEDK